MKLTDIIKNTEYELIGLCGDEEIMYITTHIKECDKKTLLIIPNSKKAKKISFDNCCAAAVMCDCELVLPSHMPRIIVEDTRIALAYAFSNYYSVNYEKMKIIGVTGTNGKTSTAHFIEEALLSGGAMVGAIGTGRIAINRDILSEENYSMTTPDPSLLYKSLKRMELSGCTHVVMEVSSHALTLHKVDPISFEYGIMTNLSPEHMDFHVNIDDYYNAKSKLFTMCKNAVFNIDDPYCQKAYNDFPGRKISAGVLFRGDVFATDIEDHGFDGIRYLYHGTNFTFAADLKIAGIYNVYNSMLAITVATDMGISPCTIKNAISSLKMIEGRFEIIKDDITVIIDYAHTDSALECILKSIGFAKGKGRLTVLFGAGGERDKEKRPRMAKATEKYADKIVVTTDNSRNEDPLDIICDIIRGFEKKSYTVCPDRAQAIREAILDARSGDTVAIIGKGHERYNIDKTGYHSFDERNIINDSLLERKKHENKA